VNRKQERFAKRIPTWTGFVAILAVYPVMQELILHPQRALLVVAEQPDQQVLGAELLVAGGRASSAASRSARQHSSGVPPSGAWGTAWVARSRPRWAAS
jgi:hypothetical protein